MRFIRIDLLKGWGGGGGNEATGWVLNVKFLRISGV